MKDEVDAGEEVDDADEELPDEAAGGVGFEGEDEVGDAAEDHEPAEEEGDGDAGDDGTRMAKSPATMRRMLRAMDQLMALGTRAVRVDGVVLIVSSISRRYWAQGWAENIIML